LADKCGGFRIFSCVLFYRWYIFVGWLVVVVCLFVRSVFYFFYFFIVCVVVGVAFVTLLQHKVLGNIHVWRGPSRTGFVGILQPISDAIKLFSREQYFPLLSNYLPYYFSPIFGLFLSLVT
jgi:NADH-ubiquinone oxidoreductase chain 1